MNDEEITLAALQEALENHFRAKTNGRALLVNWIVQMGGVEAERTDVSHSLWDVPNHQPWYVTLGLVETLKRGTSHQMTRYSDPDDDDNED